MLFKSPWLTFLESQLVQQGHCSVPERCLTISLMQTPSAAAAYMTCLHLQGDGTPFAAAWGAKRSTAARKGDLPAETPAGKALLAALHTGRGLS